jgi:hypothetical protein
MNDTGLTDAVVGLVKEALSKAVSFNMESASPVKVSDASLDKELAAQDTMPVNRDTTMLCAESHLVLKLQSRVNALWSVF